MTIPQANERPFDSMASRSTSDAATVTGARLNPLQIGPSVRCHNGVRRYTHSVPKSLGLRDGFAWWLPIALAALAAAVAVIASQTVASAWDADVHLWAREGRSASEYAELLLDPAVQDAATSGMMVTEDGSPELNSVAVELTDTLIRVTVRAPRQADAESLAISLAYAAVNEAYIRYGDEVGLDVLGLARPGARKVAPITEWTAAWASAIGLAGGLALAWSIARKSSRPPSTLGRLGRIGFRPLAVISAEAEAVAGGTTYPSSGAVVSATHDRGVGDEALVLADAIESVSGVVALVPLDDQSRVSATLTRTARALAGRGRPVIWLDSRRPAFELRYSAPPLWLAGASWSPVSRLELILRAASHVRSPDVTVLLLTDSLADAPTPAIAEAAAAVILLARADASDAELVQARLMLGAARLLGVALTQASTPDLRDFELAQMTE